MSDPDILDRLLRTCDYRFRTIHCPHKDKDADITAARWQINNNHWTRWTVIDCPLLPAGEVWCERECLSQLEDPPQ